MPPTNEQDKANQKPAVAAPAPAPAEQPAQPPEGAAPEFSTTASAERVTAPQPAVAEKDRAAAQQQVDDLTKQRDALAEETRLAAGDASKQGGLLARKGNLTRQIDALKRANGID
jgi:hypothetical protein